MSCPCCPLDVLPNAICYSSLRTLMRAHLEGLVVRGKEMLYFDSLKTQWSGLRSVRARILNNPHPVSSSAASTSLFGGRPPYYATTCAPSFLVYPLLVCPLSRSGAGCAIQRPKWTCAGSRRISESQYTCGSDGIATHYLSWNGTRDLQQVRRWQ